MHGLKTMAYLNKNAVADKMLAKKPVEQLSAQQSKDFAEALAKVAK